MNVLVKYKNLFLSFRQKVSLINIVGQVALIVTSILLANYIKEKYFDKRDRDEYLSLLYCDLQESLCDLRRDSTGHEIAFRNGQQMDQIISKMSKWDLSILNDSCKWDYLNSDFQFYPNAATYESLKSRGFEILNIHDSLDQDIISLYEVDFRRIRGIGKEESKTRNLKVLWQPVFDDYFRISFDSSMVFDQREGKAYIGNIDFQRFSSVLKDTIVDFDYFKDLLRTKIHLSNEIRKTKIEYYKYACWKAGAIANKIRNVIGEDCLCSFRCPDAKN